MIPYELTRSGRKSISVQVVPPGTVRVRCPKNMKKAEIEVFLEAHRDWIQKRLQKLQSCPPPLSEEALAALREQARVSLSERAAFYAPLMGVTYGKITVRCQKTRWGSCSSLGNLNFNCLLAKMPPEILDYVVIHELCHRKQMNHSPAFWAEVKKYCPDYPACRRWLRENGDSLMALLP